MKLTLQRMDIENFKGIRHQTILFANTTHIAGRNGTGKSSVVDAFCWLLFNKDSHGNAPGSDKFREKPQDGDGQERHNLDTAVEAEFLLDGKPFCLRRVQREVWVKKRGNAQAVFQGNASAYWINGVETSLGDYRARIGQIAGEDVFRLVASLSAFNALDWQKRREQLFALSGSDVDGELLARPEYSSLADEAAQRNISIADLRKVLADQRKRTNEELKMLPVRIDEARQALPDLTAQEIRDADYLLRDTLADLERLDGYLAEARAQQGTDEPRRKVLALEQELLSVQHRLRDEHEAGRRQLQAEADFASETFLRASAAHTDARRRLDAAQEELALEMTMRDSLRRDFRRVRDTPVQCAESICPACGQALAEDAVAAAREQAAAARREALQSIREQGLRAAEKVSATQQAVETIEAETAACEQRMHKALADRDAAYERLQAYPPFDGAQDSRIRELTAQLDEAKVAAASPEDAIQGYLRRREELQDIAERGRAVLARRDARLATEQRIAALEAQHKEYGSRLSDLEKLLSLCERFLQARCSALETSINSRFPSIRWKLFNQQINGSIVDCCMCMIPCDSGLVAYESANTASQIRADIEIIDVLSRQYDLYLPLFVDNSERVNDLPPTAAQLITLSVSTDSELTITHKEEIE